MGIVAGLVLWAAAPTIAPAQVRNVDLGELSAVETALAGRSFDLHPGQRLVFRVLEERTARLGKISVEPGRGVTLATRALPGAPKRLEYAFEVSPTARPGLAKIDVAGSRLSLSNPLRSFSFTLRIVAPIRPRKALVNTRDWHAWENRMPPGPPALHVTGVVTIANPGVEAKLVMASPQGVNPAVLVLDLILTQKQGDWLNSSILTTVRYDIANYQANHQTVLVREPDGDTVSLSIDIVH